MEHPKMKVVWRAVQILGVVVANVLGAEDALSDKIGGTTTKTVEQYFFNVTDIAQDQNIETYLTTIDGYLAGNPNPLASFTFNLPFGDAAVQSSFASIRHSLTNASSDPLSFLGPTLAASLRAKISTSVAGVNGPFDSQDGTVLDVTTTELVGEDAFYIPQSGRCIGLIELYSFCSTEGEHVFVAAGDTVLLTSADILFDVTRTTTTTNTFLTTQRYSIVGASIATPSVPEPDTLLLLAPIAVLVAFRARHLAA
jgi:hypothetical protein